MANEVRIWEIRSPDGGATGLEFARARMGVHDVVLAHSLPERIVVEVFDGNRNLIARGRNLKGEGRPPMARLDIRGDSVERENVWPDESDVGKPVILPGGDVGVLLEWWNAEDHSEWRWRVEFHNHR